MRAVNCASFFLCVSGVPEQAMSAMFSNDPTSMCVGCALGAMLVLLLAQEIMKKREKYSQMPYTGASNSDKYNALAPPKVLPLQKHDNRISVSGINFSQATHDRLRVPFESGRPH
jgi:hypothetical protein